MEFFPCFFSFSMDLIKSIPWVLPSLPLISNFLKRSAVSFEVIFASKLTRLLPASSLVPAVTRACWFATNNASKPFIPDKPADLAAAICCGNKRAISDNSKLPACPAATALSNTAPI